jgi:hypothetical protein
MPMLFNVDVVAFTMRLNQSYLFATICSVLSELCQNRTERIVTNKGQIAILFYAV